VFWLAWVVLLPTRWSAGRPRPTRIAVESGRIGWGHVFYEELWDSLVEYLPQAEFVRVVIDRDLPYRPQAREWTRDRALTHAVIDLRTGPQTWGRALADTLATAWRLGRRGVVPVVILTDASLRRHRVQAAVLTAHRGITVTFMDRARVRGMFPHGRIIGPLPMPVSEKRLNGLPEPTHNEGEVAFIGSVYPPRSFFLDLLGQRLAEQGVRLVVHGNKADTSNDDYWRVLSTSGVIVTTTLQGMPRRGMDWIWIPQLVFRFSEALSAGAVLVAPIVEGGDRFFTPGSDFAPFTSVDDAVAVLVRLSRDSAEQTRLRHEGHRTAVDLAREHTFWRTIDTALARDGFSAPVV
jgi:hypothetical protein